MFEFLYDSFCSSVNNNFFFSKLVIFIACSLKNSKKKSYNLYLCIQHAYFQCFLKNDIVGIEKPDGICSLTFVVNQFSGLFLHLQIFFNMHSRSA